MTQGLWQFDARLFQHKSLLLPFQELLKTCYLLWLFLNFLSPGAVKSDAGSTLPSLLLQSPAHKPKESPLLRARAGCCWQVTRGDERHLQPLGTARSVFQVFPCACLEEVVLQGVADGTCNNPNPSLRFSIALKTQRADTPQC